MSPLISLPSDSSKTEPEIVVNWRMIALAAALAALFVVVATVGFLCFSSQKAEPTVRPVVEQSSRPAAAAPRTESPRFRFDQGTIASLAPGAPSPVETPEPVPMPRAILDARPRITAAAVRPEPPEPAPAEQPAMTAAAPTASRKFKRIDRYYEFESLRQLSDVPELDLDQSSKTALLAARIEPSAGKDGKAATGKKEPTHALLDLAAKRGDLQGLPLRQAKDCQKKKETAQVMQALSRYFRSLDGRSGSRRALSVDRGDDLKDDLALVRILDQAELPKQVKELARNPKWDGKLGSEELAVLVQMLQLKGPAVRLKLVKLLDACKEVPASVLLAQRALFDLDEAVREAAIAALNTRPRAQYRQILLDGLRHPWPPIAAHAAEALAALQDIDAVGKLAELLDSPDPTAPARDAKNRWVVKEMVGINHLRNCVLCHASSHDVSDPGRSPVPKPGEELPVVYYENIKGDAVRADITYLRQDFSALQIVEKPDKWPYVQRFDYVVRNRELTAEEERAYLNGGAPVDPTDYPQRSAVLFALRELTGEDAGTSSADWGRLLGKTGLDDSR